ncbi:hypothetical protein [Dokdonia sp. 4H-3-7-5]|uniref:hypothetical protein n=1 Tax=Dokdonia sp. (strain 4H-3-7-5) TaxID=983548 RepID=UPI00020A6F7D|nr:hypothetical protein [Dokdonia sp. 4H-3-7-5]AEE19682.1 sec7 domain family member [Dokdonia sp. 4H-3-7-5]
MNAQVVYNLVKTLPKEEFDKLYHMMKNEFNIQTSALDPKRSKKHFPDITVREMEIYLIENHFNKK